MSVAHETCTKTGCANFLPKGECRINKQLVTEDLVINDETKETFWCVAKE